MEHGPTTPNGPIDPNNLSDEEMEVLRSIALVSPRPMPFKHDASGAAVQMEDGTITELVRISYQSAFGEYIVFHQCGAPLDNFMTKLHNAKTDAHNAAVELHKKQKTSGLWKPPGLTVVEGG